MFIFNIDDCSDWWMDKVEKIDFFFIKVVTRFFYIFIKPNMFIFYKNILVKNKISKCNRLESIQLNHLFRMLPDIKKKTLVKQIEFLKVNYNENLNFELLVQKLFCEYKFIL